MNLFELSTVVCESAIEASKKDINPLNVDVFIKDSEGLVFEVGCANLMYSEKLNTFILVLSDDD